MSECPNFGNYSYAELLEAYNGVDEQRFPERKAQIKDLLFARKDTEEARQLLQQRRFADRYATFWPRFFASWIDGVVIYLALYLLVNTAGAAAHGSFKFYVLQLINTFFAISYSVLMHAYFGATMGKALLDLKVVQEPGEGDIGWREALLRDSVPLVLIAASYLISIFGAAVEGLPLVFVAVMGAFGIVWWAAELVTMLLHPKRRAVHDLLAGTVVIRQ